MLEIRLLGTFAIRANNKAVAIASRPAQSLFAYLILNAGTSHRREKLAGMLWPDSLEETARDNLRHALWRMRKALEAASATRFLHADDVEIGFKESSEFWLDVAALQKLSGDTSADQLIAVLSEYQGELLPGFYDEWVILQREHLYSIFEHHMARLMSLLQEEKRWIDILDWAERWIKLGQKPEPAYRALMSAHAAKGDMSKVAATYERCVKSLKEFRIEPSKQTKELFERLKTGQEDLESGSNLTPGKKPEEPANTNLPVPLTSFVGREREMEEVKQLLATTRLLTLTGTGGIGKTRLALQSANNLISSFKDGVWWMELAPVKDSSLLPQTVAQLLGVRELPGQSLMASLRRSLQDKESLLILDNCEHLIASCAQLAGDLLSHCSHLSILATSRESLGIIGETVVQVPVLSFPTLSHVSQLQSLQEFESVRLFVERAAAVHPPLALTPENAFAVAQICQRLDGIPLAIELAARIKIFSLQEIAARLDDRFTLLTQGSRTALPRHQTLRALIDWSHDLLPELERILWRRLSVFIGGWTLDAAEFACVDDILELRQVWELLSHLIDKSLVVVDEQNGSTRYRMLETIRQYGQEKLQLSGEATKLSRFHFRFFSELAEKATSRLLTAEQNEWFAKLDSEYGNLRGALDWALEYDIVSALQMATALAQYWEVRGYVGEGRATLERALPRAQDIPKAVRADALRWQAKFAARQGDYERAKAPLEESRKLSRELGDKSGMARSLHNSGMVSSLQGHYAAAKASYEAALALLKETGDKREMAALTTSLGNVANYLQHYETARRYQEESVSLFRELGDKFGLFIALNNLGLVLERQGHNAAAQRYYEESIATAYELGEKNLVAYALNGLAHLHYLENDLAEANYNYRKSLLISQEIGERRCIAYCLEGFAKIALRVGNASRAAHLLGAADSLRQTIGAPLIHAERQELNQDVTGTRKQIGERMFETAFAEGRAMTIEQAANYALKET